jgi:hypothetical protein
MPTPPFLLRLMNHHALARTTNLGPEDSEAYAFANELRAATLEGRLLAVFTHPANELAGLPPSAPRSFLVRAAIARALGLITGTSDYLFLAGDCSLAMEFKAGRNGLTPAQRDFRAWCEQMGVSFYLVRSCAEGLAVLRERGLLA